tara:strand:+ start:56 stop:238 length:183 start_codon:yes stop_codon:yes gene_type:complete
MTPFEQAEHNIKRMSERLILFSLIQSTIKDTEGMTEHETDLVWEAVFALLEKSGMLGDAN